MTSPRMTGGPHDVGYLSYKHTQLWAGQGIATSLLLYFSRQELTIIKYHMPIFVAIAVVVISAAHFRRRHLVQAAVLTSSVVRAIMTMQLPFRTEVPNLLRYADLPTYLLTFLPEMMMLGFKFDASLLMFFLSHAGICAFSYYETDVHNIVVSICRAFAIHAVCLFMYLAIGRNAKRMYVSGVLSDNSPKADVQLQGEAQEPQQRCRQHSLHQHKEHHQDKKPATARQQLGQEETGVCVDEQHLDGVAAGVSHCQMNKPQGPAGLCTVPAPAPVEPSDSSTPVAFKSYVLGGKSQPQCLGLHSGVLSAPASQQLHKRQVDADLSGSNISTGSSISCSSVSNSSLSSSSISSRPSLPILQSKPSHPRLHSAALAKALGPKAVVDALGVWKETPNQAPYVSQLSRPGSSRPDATMQDYVQAVCRLAVKVRGPGLPSSLPGGAVPKLSDRLQKYQRLMPAESPAVRAGCLVISYGAMPISKGSALQEMRQETVAEAKDWAQEYGLLPLEEDGLLTVQVCRQSSWVSNSAPPRPDCLPEYSIHVLEPFIEANPASLEQEAFCAFDVSLIAPPHLELRGWKSAADAPEELPDDVKHRSLCFLASIDGQHVGTSVVEQHPTSNGERLVQVRTSLQNCEALFDAATPHPKVLVLELWAGGGLVCSYASVLFPYLYSGALEELHSWADVGVESSVFVRDLVIFTHFQANHMSALQEREHWMAMVWGHDEAADQADVEVRQVMLAVGADLLAHCLEHRMSTLAGMLLDALAYHACFRPLSDLNMEIQDEQPETAQLQGSAFPSSGPTSAQQLQPPHSPPPPDVLPNPSSSCPQPGILAPDSATSIPAPPVLSSSAPTLASSAATTTPEEAYQAWKNLQLTPLATSWSKVQMMFVVVVAFRSWYERGASLEGTPAFLSEETLMMTLMLATYFIGALFLVHKAGSYTEHILAVMLAVRAAFCVLLGLRVAPVPDMLQPILQWRVEVLIEIMTMSVVEQIRLPLMLPLRLVLTIGFGLWYERAGLWAPWFQAILLNACSLAVAKAIDTRYRRMYAFTLLSDAKQIKAT